MLLIMTTIILFSSTILKNREPVADEIAADNAKRKPVHDLTDFTFSLEAFLDFFVNSDIPIIQNKLLKHM